VARVEGDAEAIELLVTRGPLVDRPLREVQLPKGALIGAILRQADHTVEIPSGESVIRPQDTVILFTLPHARAEAQALISPSV